MGMPKRSSSAGTLPPVTAKNRCEGISRHEIGSDRQAHAEAREAAHVGLGPDVADRGVDGQDPGHVVREGLESRLEFVQIVICAVAPAVNMRELK